MGWGIMPEGTKQTNQHCGICCAPVVAGQKFYFRNKVDVVHAGCAWEEEEKRQVAMAKQGGNKDAREYG